MSQFTDARDGVENFFGGIVSEVKKLVGAFNASTFGQGLEASGAAVLKEVGALSEQALTNIVTSGAGAAAAAVATGGVGGEAAILSAAAAAMRSQATMSGVQLTTAALTSLAAHVTTSVSASASAAPVVAVAAPMPDVAGAAPAGANNLNSGIV